MIDQNHRRGCLHTGKDHGTTVSKHSKLNARDLLIPADSVARDPAGYNDGLVKVGMVGDGRHWKILLDAHHSKDHDKNVEPNVDIGKPRKVSEGTDLATCHANKHEEDIEGDVAELPVDHLDQGLPVADDQQRHVEEQLERLEDVENVARPAAKHTLAQVCIACHRVLGAVQIEVEAPDDLAGKNGQEVKKDVDKDARAVAQLVECLGGTGETKNVGGNQIEDGLPRGNAQSAVRSLFLHFGYSPGSLLIAGWLAITNGLLLVTAVALANDPLRLWILRQWRRDPHSCVVWVADLM